MARVLDINEPHHSHVDTPCREFGQLDAYGYGERYSTTLSTNRVHRQVNAAARARYHAAKEAR